MPNTQVRILFKPKSSARSSCSIEKRERGGGREKIYKSADDVWAFLLFLAISTEVDELVAAAAATERNDDDGTGGRGSGGYITDALLEEQKKKKDLS